MKAALASGTLVERDQRVLWHPYTQMQTAPPPLPVVRGKDARLITENGEEYLDAVSSWWVNIHGHGNTHIADRIAAQARELEHCIFAGFTHPPAVELAEKVLELLPESQARIFYSDNGSTAVEVALKMALQYWHNKGISRRRLLAFRHAYHGDTFGAMSVSGRSLFTKAFDEYLFEVDFVDIPAGDPYGSGVVTLPANRREVMPEPGYFQSLEDTLSSGQHAAFIFEPLLLGSGGMLMYSPAALDQIMALCRQYGVLIIADEVMTGFGRTGRALATDYCRHDPDIFCLSKGLTGGTMALGITSCTALIYDAFLSADKTKTLFHGHSFTANPIACSAALASMELFRDPACARRIEHIAGRMSAFRAELEGHGLAGHVRQCGTVLAFEIITPESDSYIHGIRDFLYDFFLRRKIILRPLGNTLYMMPPYCISDEELDRVYAAVSDLLGHLEKEGLP